MKKLRDLLGRGSKEYSSPPHSNDTPVVHLRVQVISCHSLVAMDRGGQSSDPFVTVTLLGKQFQTPVIKQNLNPEYDSKDATFNFPIYMSLGHKFDKLEFVVWDKDRISKNDYLGEYSLPINRWFRGTAFGFDDSNNEPFTVHLVSSQPMDKPIDGTMFLKVGFVRPSDSTRQVDFGRTYNRLIADNKHLKAGMLIVEIDSIKDLPEWANATHTGFDMDPFVKVSIGKEPEDVRCTSIKEHKLNPKWNEQLFFHVDKDLSLPIRLTVFDRDKFTPNDFVGEVVIDDASIVERVEQGADLNTWPPYLADSTTKPKFVVRSLAKNNKKTYTAAGRPCTPEITFRARYLPYV